ncbi:hypothetical protein TNIN_101861 [Trichonephila inaurata madagascariensis]|uniref:Uncharacterized protein n=1 Tax=Trichonephila inaurata madagascariensis TaxID=2747483 RepID=A0A8X6YER9_9ARAC|nr:hypothetical protein TNIN_101861 [Trichonephila inaurata madagascariensis]
MLIRLLRPLRYLVTKDDRCRAGMIIIALDEGENDEWSSIWSKRDQLSTPSASSLIVTSPSGMNIFASERVNFSFHDNEGDSLTRSWPR